MGVCKGCKFYKVCGDKDRKRECKGYETKKR